MMAKRKIIVRAMVAVFLMAGVAMTGCAQWTEMTYQKMFQEPMDKYRRAILWSDFETAAQSIHPDFREENPIGDKFHGIKVTDYDIKRLVVAKDNSFIRQIVKIHYYHTHRMVEKSLIDQQEWRWHPESKMWYLISGLPRFQ